MHSFFFVLRCPKCGHDMKYHTPTRILTDKRKRCVYCGSSFKVRENMVKEVRG